MLTDADRVPLRARAWVADGVRGALVAADGTVDWYCPEGFDRPPALWRLLDRDGAAIRVGPLREGSWARRRLPPGEQGYRPGSMVARTTMRAGGSVLLVEDALVWHGGSSTPPGRLVRLATALAGPVEVEVEVLPGRLGSLWQPVSAWGEGVVSGALVVRTGVGFEPATLRPDRPRWRATRRLDAGESMVVTVDPVGSDAPALSVDGARRLLDETAGAWQSWLAPFAISGSCSEPARRAALVVRSLTGPTGAPLAAGTTSIARRPGGERTSDDRLCRLRDAAAAARSLAAAGLEEDAEAAEAWLRGVLEASELPWPSGRTPSGDPPAEAEEVPLGGWRGGQPVVFGPRPTDEDRDRDGWERDGLDRDGRARDGGRARGTPGDRARLADLDLYGDVELAVSASHRGPFGDRRAGPLAGAREALAAGTDWVADHWELADAGIWDLPRRPSRLVASCVQAWVALDRAARRVRATDPLDLSAAGWQAEARRVLGWLEAEGVHPDGGLRASVPLAGAQSAGGRSAESGAGGSVGPADSDAALLRVAWQGPWPAGHPVVVATIERVLERHASGLLVYRLPEGADDGRPGPDSPDLLCSLWAVRALAHLGRWEEAHERMEAVLAPASPGGLLSEAADPVSGELYGNLPSSAVGLAVIAAAADLASGPA